MGASAPRTGVVAREQKDAESPCTYVEEAMVAISCIRYRGKATLLSGLPKATSELASKWEAVRVCSMYAVCGDAACGRD